MLRAKIIQLFFLLSLTCSSQNKIKPLYSFAINNSLEHVISIAPGLESYNSRAIGYYISLGLQKQFDSVFVFQTSLRYGREKSSFEIYRNGELLTNYYFFSNRTLTFFVSPGLIINKRQKLFLMFGITRFYQSNVGGSGTRSNGLGERNYKYAIHLNRNSIDYRLGLKWQVKPDPRKKINFEIGAEASPMEHRSLIEITSQYNNQPAELYQLNYSAIIIYLGFNFN